MGGLLLSLLVSCIGVNGWAKTNPETTEGYYEVEPGISLWAKVKPGAPGAGLILELNGLTQDSDH